MRSTSSSFFFQFQAWGIEKAHANALSQVSVFFSFLLHAAWIWCRAVEPCALNDISVPSFALQQFTLFVLIHTPRSGTQIGVTRDFRLDTSSQCALHYPFPLSQAFCGIHFETLTWYGVKYVGRPLNFFIFFSSLFPKRPRSEVRVHANISSVVSRSDMGFFEDS